MNYWLRLYTGILDDPKVQRLEAEHFKGWINLLCLAKEHDGLLPSLEDIAFRLRMSEADAQNLIDELVRRGLLETKGNDLTPHNWHGRQFQSDVSTGRVKRFRNARRNVSETLQSRDRAETEAEQSRAKASGSDDGGNGNDNTPFDSFDDPLAEMAQAVATAMGLAEVPEGYDAKPIHEAAGEFVAAKVCPADVGDYETDYYQRKARQGSNYPLTLKILREDLPGWVRARRMRQAAKTSNGAAEPARPPVVTAPANYRQPKQKGETDSDNPRRNS